MWQAIMYMKPIEVRKFIQHFNKKHPEYKELVDKIGE